MNDVDVIDQFVRDATPTIEEFVTTALQGLARLPPRRRAVERFDPSQASLARSRGKPTLAELRERVARRSACFAAFTIASTS